jgi:hypothetical protein
MELSLFAGPEKGTRSRKLFNFKNDSLIAVEQGGYTLSRYSKKGCPKGYY